MERYFTWEVTVLLITCKAFLERITWCCDYCSFLDFAHTVSTFGRSYFVCHLSYITTVLCDSWLHANSYSSQFALYFSTQPEHLCPVRFHLCFSSNGFVYQLLLAGLLSGSSRVAQMKLGCCWWQVYARWAVCLVKALAPKCCSCS